jgi:hypothetical protein
VDEEFMDHMDVAVVSTATLLVAGAVVQSDGVVIPARVHAYSDGHVVFAANDGVYAPSGRFRAGLEGIRWARGEWDSEAVVALRSLAALDSSR